MEFVLHIKSLQLALDEYSFQMEYHQVFGVQYSLLFLYVSQRDTTYGQVYSRLVRHFLI